MEPPSLAARYHLATRTLEFDLADAPLIDAIVEVSVLSTNCVPSVDPTRLGEERKGLFYGKDTFLFEEPFVFDKDTTMLMCWLRLREHRIAALRSFANEMLQGQQNTTAASIEDVRAHQRECVVVLHSAIPPEQRCAEFMYFVSSPDPRNESNNRCLLGGLGDLSASPSPSRLPDRCPPSNASLFLTSATALCFET